MSSTVDVPASASSAQGTPHLRRNAIGLTGAVIMSAAIMGPAVSTFFNPQFSTPFSGSATPFVYFACVVILLIAASGIVEMAREFPSAGAFYTYVTRGLGPKPGFVTGMLMFVAYALLPPAEIGLIGGYLQSTFRDEFSTNIPWWIIGMVPAVLMIVLALGGIRTSLRTALILFSLEVFIVLLLSLIIVFRGGAHGLTLHPLSPGASPHGFSGLTTGFVFAALSFVGFEGAATLGDEVKNPRIVVPKAILYSVAAVGLLYVFCIWAEVNGLGVSAADKLPSSATPWNDLAQHFASWMKWPVIIASVSSMFAVMINSANGITRILNTMGREGLLPRALAYVSPKHQSPSRAIVATGTFAIVLALIVGALGGGLGDPAGGFNTYGYLGFLLTLAILPVYVLVNLAAARYFYVQKRFNVLRHGILPLGGAGLMIALLYGQIYEQSVKPYTWFHWVIVAWIVLAIAGAFWLGAVRPDALKRAGSALATGDVEDAAEPVPAT